MSISPPNHPGFFPLGMGAFIQPPAAWPTFLERHPHHATAFSLPLSQIPNWALRAIRDFNVYVNAQFRYTPDASRDEWNEFLIPQEYVRRALTGGAAGLPKLGPWLGDCEDYVWTKRAALAHHLGLGALAPLICQPAGMRPHMVLAILTSQGAHILDNRQDNILRLTPTWKAQAIYADGLWQKVAVVKVKGEIETS